MAEFGSITSGAVRREVERLSAGKWRNVTFQNSWVNESTADFQGVQYRKVGDEVQLRGSMQSGTNAAVAFTLPEGYRPPKIQRFPAITGSLGVGALDVEPDGDVIPRLGTGTNTNFGVEARFSTRTN